MLSTTLECLLGAAVLVALSNPKAAHCRQPRCHLFTAAAAAMTGSCPAERLTSML